MRVSYSSYIARSEWNWLMAVAALIVTLTGLPVVITSLLTATRPDWEFMGAVHHTPLVAADLSRMFQGGGGQILTFFRHTAEPHLAVFVQPIYALLGGVAAFTGIPNPVIYHVGRILASLFTAVALYHLGANIWVKVRARRIFFVLAWLGGGIGFYWMLLDPSARPVDIALPWAYPFYAALVSIDLPLSIGFIALISSVFINVLRPGFREGPTVNNGGVPLVLSSLVLALLHPAALLPLMGAFMLCVVVDWVSQRQLVVNESRWLLWGVVPALPIAAYLAAAFSTNPVVSLWLSQEYQARFKLIDILLSNALMLAVAAPAIWRAVRSFERDSDRFMLLWLLAVILLGAFAPRFSNNFLAAYTLPLAYFATRAVDSLWLEFVQRAWQRRVYVIASLFLAVTPLVAAFSPLVPIINHPERSSAILPTAYRDAVSWIDAQTSRSVVILASPTVSAWIPAMSRHRVVYGHPTETMFADVRRLEVLEWYHRADASDCDLMATQQRSTLGSFYVEYALVGPAERELGAAACAARWALVHSVGEVDVYQCDLACRTGSR
jgi:hypothetical protein